MASPSPPVQVQELDAVSVQQEDGSVVQLRSFSLTCQNVTVEVCNVGASITKILLPRRRHHPNTNNNDSQEYDDIVLGFSSPSTLLLDNSPYFGVIVGRVANRIAHGTFELNDQTYQLAVNNEPNHLHGGIHGFHQKIWNASIIPNQQGVQFSLVSPHGDEGYPGTIQVVATYSLQPSTTSSSTTLRLDMEACLLEDGPTARLLSTPINLAQHSYFNLAGHSHPHGILDHTLYMPNCHSYTPKDPVTSIPTRQIQSVHEEDPCMDWTSSGRLLRDGLMELAVQHEGLTKDEAQAHVQQRLQSPLFVPTSAAPATTGQPYGFDDNYIVDQTKTTDEDDEDDEEDGNARLPLVAVLEHASSQRRLTVRSNTPGVQVYTANYVNGNVLDATKCKDAATYGPWQGICLETQHYPDSIITSNKEELLTFAEFAKGKCVILCGKDDKYHHTMEYEFGNST